MNPKLAGVAEEGTSGAGNIAGAGRTGVFGARIRVDVAREDEGRRGGVMMDVMLEGWS